MMPPETCKNIQSLLVEPLIKGEFDGIDLARKLKPILLKLIKPAASKVSRSLNVFGNALKSFNVCLPIYTNRNYWKSKLSPVVEMFKGLDKKIKDAKEIVRSAQKEALDCKKITIMFTCDIGLFRNVGKERGIYLTFEEFKVIEVGLVDSTSKTSSLVPKIPDSGDLSVGGTLAILMGGKDVWGGWGYTISIDGSIPISGVGVGGSKGLIFAADQETLSIGNFIGISISISFSLGDDSVKPEFDASITCAYAAATSIKNTFKRMKCDNVGTSSKQRSEEDLRSLEGTVTILEEKLDQLKNCSKLYECGAKQCIYNLDPNNIKEKLKSCDSMAGKCGDDVKECIEWEHECKNK